MGEVTGNGKATGYPGCECCAACCGEGAVCWATKAEPGPCGKAAACWATEAGPGGAGGAGAPRTGPALATGGGGPGALARELGGSVGCMVARAAEHNLLSSA